MRQLPLAVSLAFSVLLSSAVAFADPTKDAKPKDEASEAVDLTIPSMPSIPILPDATASQLYRVCTAINTLTDHVDKPFSPEKVNEAVAEARKIAAAPVTPPAPDPRKPTVQALFVDALGSLSGACAAIEAGQLELSEESWTALRTWRSQSTKWNRDLVQAINIVSAERTTIPEAFEGASGLVGSGDFQSMILNGLADFLVTRAKAEAAVYLQAQLKKNLCTPEAKPYVPAICGAMMQLDGSISLNATGTYLQASARRDLEMLPLRVLREKASTSDPQSAALLALMLYSEARRGRQPLELLTNVDGITCEKNGATIFSKNVAKASCRASQLIRTMQGLRMDVSEMSDPFRWVAVPLRFEVAFPEPSKEHLPIALANRLVKGAVTMNASLKQIEKLATEIAKGLSSSPLIPGVTPTGTKAFGAKDKTQVVAQSISLLIQMTNLLGCADEASAECKKAKSLEDAQSVVTLGTALFSGEVGEMVVATTDLMEHYQVTVPASIVRVLPLLTEIANAKSSKDVSATLEAAAAPVGSYSAKYERNVMGINAFVGGSAGLEWVSYNNAWQRSGEVGLFVPIGLEASTPLGKYFHIGALFSVLDLGSLVSTRLTDETTTVGDTKTEIKDRGDLSFAQVFSPGLFVTVGVAKSPITIGAGLSLTPSLRNQLTTNTTTQLVTSSEDLTAFRAQVFAGFDLTLLPF